MIQRWESLRLLFQLNERAYAKDYDAAKPLVMPKDFQ